MTNRSENNLTEIMARAAQRLYTAERDSAIKVAGADAIHAEAQIMAWDDMDTYQQSRVKQGYLPLMMAVLDSQDEVDAERSTEEAIKTEGESALNRFAVLGGYSPNADEEVSYKIGFRDGWRRALVR